MATFDEFFSSLDLDESGKLNKNKTAKGLPFERFVKWFLENDPVWSSKIDKVWLNEEKDLGVDLIFDDTEGKRWAVQSKCYSPTTYVTKKSIDSFISDSDDSRYQGRLLIASTDRIGINADKTLKRNRVIRYLLTDFRNSCINFPSSLKDLSKGKKKDLRTPRLHQEEAITAVLKGLKTADRGQVLMACGTGKTLTSLWVKERLKARQVLVLLPSLSLLSQTLKEWNAAASEPFKWICVCSDQSVAKKDKTEDDWISNTSEIGLPVTNEIKEIQYFLNEKGSKIVFSTYQSSLLIAEAQKEIDIPIFDIVFADEAHRCAGKVSDAFGCILDEQKIRATKRLFFTATPRVLSNQIKGQAKANEIQVASMDDYSIFGEILYEIKFSQAIARDLLSDYQVIVVGVDDPMIQQKIINRDIVTTDGKDSIDAEKLAAYIAVGKSIKEYDLCRLITFHGRVKGAKEFAEDFKNIVSWTEEKSRPSGIINCDYVSGAMKSSERNEKIQRLKEIGEEERIILSNARCLSEGVDVPTLDGIAFIDPRSSQIDIIQAVGRAIRKSDNKRVGTIILPVYLGDAANTEDEILASRFSDIWQIILALKSQDDSLMETIDHLRINLGSKNPGRKEKRIGLTKIIFDLPERVSRTFCDSIETLLIKSSSDQWLENYGKLVSFVETNGHARPSRSDEFIGKWVSKQRYWYQKNKLSKEKIKLLENLKDWVWDVLEAIWFENLEELERYIKKTNNLPPARKSRLGTWVSAQRSLYKNQKMPKHHIEILEKLDNWIWDISEEEWNEKFSLLRNYVLKEGNACPSQKEKTCGGWVTLQRQEFRKGKLSQEKIKKLEALEGWVWDPHNHIWEENFEKLIHYQKKHGNTNPPNKSPFGDWVTYQRVIYKRGELSEERIKKLENIDGWFWDFLTDIWNKKYRELGDFHKKNNGSFPRANSTGLGTWISSQRSSYAKQKLSQEKINLLENLSGWSWDPRNDQWMEKFQKLKIFQQTKGHANPPQKIKEIGPWVAIQRQRYKKKLLTTTQINLLNQLKNWKW